MASLQNAQIDQSYQGLIKTADNTSTIPFPPQNLQFGDGTAFPIEIADLSAFGAGTSIALKSGTNQVAVDGTGFVIDTAGGIMTANAGTVKFKNGTYNFGDAGSTTSVDFANATVTGLPAGATPGLVLGTGSATDEGAPLSMASGAAVTTIAAQARGGGDIAIGDGAITPVGGAQYPTDCIAIGHDATVTNEKAMAFGKNARAQGNKSYAAGYFSLASAANSTAIGKDAEASATSSSALGDNATATAASSVAIGEGVTAATANTATVNLLQIAGYAGMNYADDTAAAAGGIPLGGVYHTSGALKIRIA
jgi:hypothetical protein